MKLTPKENFIKVMHHEIPESIPVGGMGFRGYNGERPYAIVGPSILDTYDLTNSGPMSYYDPFGLRWVGNAESMNGRMPDVSDPMLKDITKWRDVIKAPDIDLNSIDWESIAKKDIANSEVNDETEARMVKIGLMPFEEFVGFMGFTEGLMAMYEEPDYVKELLNWMADIYIPVIKASIDYYKPDAAYLLDDTAAKYNPFISRDMYVEFLKPVYTKLCKPYVDAGIPIQYHNCGRAEEFYEDAVEFGVDLTDPFQVQNDLLGNKEKFMGRLAFCGGLEFEVPKDYPNFDREAMREEIHRQIDPLAKGGGYIASGGARSNGEDITELSAFIREEMYFYCQDYYNKH